MALGKGFEFRKLGPGDYESLAGILNAIFPEYRASAETIRYEYESFDKTKYISEEFVVLEKKDQKVVAYGEYSHMPNMFHPKKFWLGIYVHPLWQRKGIGTFLYNLILGKLHERGAICARTSAREDIRVAISFLQKRGFEEKMRAWELRLDVPSFDPSRFSRYPEMVKAQGIAITTLAEEEGRDSLCHQKLYELIKSVAADIPMPDAYTPVSFDEFMRNTIGHPDLIHDAFFIAKDGDAYVGLSYAFKSEEPSDLYQGLTGVLREYRGRGVAMALKLKVIAFAKRKGYRVIKTWNDSTNTAMLAVNQKLGFVRHVGWITLEKDLTR